MGFEPATDWNLNYTFSSDYELKRFVARNHRVLGGLILYTHNYPAANDCSSSFKGLGAPCLGKEPMKRPHGSDPAFNQMSALYTATTNENIRSYYAEGEKASLPCHKANKLVLVGMARAGGEAAAAAVVVGCHARSAHVAAACRAQT